MIGYVFIGIFAVIFIYIMTLYYINSKKIKNKNAQKAENVKKEEKKTEKVEVKSEITSGSPLEKAISEANDYSKNSEIEEAYRQMDAQREAFEHTNRKMYREKGLRKDRENFKTELQMAMETNQMAMENNRISSETNVIGKEGPSPEQIARTNLEIELENQNKETKRNSISNEINNMSPEAKALLLNDILDKKY